VVTGNSGDIVKNTVEPHPANTIRSGTEEDFEYEEDV